LSVFLSILSIDVNTKNWFAGVQPIANYFITFFALVLVFSANYLLYFLTFSDKKIWKTNSTFIKIQLTFAIICFIYLSLTFYNYLNYNFKVENDILDALTSSAQSSYPIIILTPILYFLNTVFQIYKLTKVKETK